MDTGIVVMQRNFCFPVLVKQAHKGDSLQMIMKEDVVQRLAGVRGYTTSVPIKMRTVT